MVFTPSQVNKNGFILAGMLLISSAMLIAESRNVIVQHVREMALPFSRWVNSISLQPYQLGQQIGLWTTSQASWVQAHQQWLMERHSLTQQQQYTTHLIAENRHLRQMLNLKQHFPLSTVTAAVVRSTPISGMVILDKGTNDGVYEGAGVMGIQGVIGVVEKATPKSAQVLLLNNTRHAIAVQSERSGVRVIVSGAGEQGSLFIDHVPDTTDIKIGDVLTTSGLGDRFPAGLMVGVVSQVNHEAGKPFATILAMPKESLSKLDYVLVLQKGDPDAGA